MLLRALRRYARWLHLRWPAGTVEKGPEVGPEGETALEGVRVVGDLSGIPLLKLSADSGARAIRAFLEEPGFGPATTKEGGESDEELLDVAIVGGGVAGISAAMEAKEQGLRYRVFEAAEAFHTVRGFPKKKPIFAYPSEMEPAGSMRFTAEVKEALLEELEGQRQEAGVEVERAEVDRVERRGGELRVHFKSEDGQESREPARARRVVIAIGKSGNHRRLGVPGEEREKVFVRLFDPAEHRGQKVLIVGGGDSALEAAIALVEAGAEVTLSYRGEELSRPKPENRERLEELEGEDHPSGGRLSLILRSNVTRIEENSVFLRVDEEDEEREIENELVFTLIGREAPLDFFRRSGIPITGEWRPRSVVSFALFLLFCCWLYTWKASGSVNAFFKEKNWFPFFVPDLLKGWSEAAADPSTFLGTLAITLEEPGFYYSLAYTFCVVAFGIARIRRRRTPYVRAQTLLLMAIQLLPLFLLPYLILPYLGHNHAFDAGFGKVVADHLFPEAGYGHGREYWRAFGFILAWPLFIWNFFTSQPMGWWLAIGLIQTFVIIPLIVWRWGKGAYCGFICSCGALAETLGDRHRHKMPHGPLWNRLNFIGQGVLAFALMLFVARAVSWWAPHSFVGYQLGRFYNAFLSNYSLLGVPLDYYHVVDIFLAGIVGVGFYFWFSGRVWCRFACPLAALMHLYARFSRFRIFAEKKKCISCNVCTSVCHQGIDVMSFANKGEPMEDPECVRCSACVQSCPTGVLTFGRLGKDGEELHDRLAASPVQMKEDGKRRLPVIG